LLNRGYTRGEIHQILSGNVLRVFWEAEQIGRDLAGSQNR